MLPADLFERRAPQLGVALRLELVLWARIGAVSWLYRHRVRYRNAIRRNHSDNLKTKLDCRADEVLFQKHSEWPIFVLVVSVLRWCCVGRCTF